MFLFQSNIMRHYLDDCFITDSVDNNTFITPSNNFVQQISNFKIPRRDTLLFFKTSRTFNLTINVIDNRPPQGIAWLVYNGRLYSWNGRADDRISENSPPDSMLAPGGDFLPIINTHHQGEFIDIRVDFILDLVLGKDRNRFLVLDEDDLDSQYNLLLITPRQNLNNEYFGPQFIRFNMPGHDLTLNIKTKGRSSKLRFEIDGFPSTYRKNSFLISNNLPLDSTDGDIHRFESLCSGIYRRTNKKML